MNTNVKASRPSISRAEFADAVGKPGGTSEWLTINQARIDSFAQVTGDDSFLHVDPDRAAKTRYGGTIAHGLLTLSLLPVLIRSATPTVRGLHLGVNYGFDRVRLIQPVPVGGRIRARFDLTRLENPKPTFHLMTYHVTVEIEGEDRPAAIADWLLGCWES